MFLRDIRNLSIDVNQLFMNGWIVLHLAIPTKLSRLTKMPIMASTTSQAKVDNQLTTGFDTIVEGIDKARAVDKDNCRSA